MRGQSFNTITAFEFAENVIELCHIFFSLLNINSDFSLSSSSCCRSFWTIIFKSFIARSNLFSNEINGKIFKDFWRLQFLIRLERESILHILNSEWISGINFIQKPLIYWFESLLSIDWVFIEFFRKTIHLRIKVQWKRVKRIFIAYN